MKTPISTTPLSKAPQSSPISNRSPLQNRAQMRRNHPKQKTRPASLNPVRITYKGKDWSPIQTRRTPRKPSSKPETALLDQNQSPAHIRETAGKEQPVPRRAATTEQGTVQKRSVA
ncbi:uncharacterized protein LOC100387363 isoform X3 [Callithrix jacchus]